MADEEEDLELGPTLTAEELAQQRLEAAVARGEILEMSSDDDDEPAGQSEDEAA